MIEPKKLTKVILLGTIHKYHYRISYFNMKVLKQVIEKINPDIICAELSPEQLDGTVTRKSKPEYPEVIIPFAKRKGCKIIPIQPDTLQGKKMEKRKKSAWRSIEKTLDGKVRIDCFNCLCDLIDRKFSELAINLRSLQSGATDLLFEMRWNFAKRILPIVAKEWEDWNQYFYVQIDEAIKLNPRKLILITVGLEHKYWLNKKFEERDDVEFQDFGKYE